MGEPGGLPSLGSHRVGHDWSDLAAAAAGHFKKLNRKLIFKWKKVRIFSHDGSDSKDSPAMLETWVWTLGQEDSLEKEMATHSISLAWRILWTEEPDGLQSVEWQIQTLLSNYPIFIRWINFLILLFYNFRKKLLGAILILININVLKWKKMHGIEYYSEAKHRKGFIWTNMAKP